MKHFIAVENHTQEELQDLITLAEHYKKNRYGNVLRNKTFISMFFNPSTRTKTTFDLAMQELGGHTVTLEPGKSSWGIEIEEGKVMDGDAEEHWKEAIKVLGRYGDAIGIRCFPKFQNWAEEKKDHILANAVKWSDKPIVNMETISHPCQALAMIMAFKEKKGDLKRKKMVLTWVYHPKGLNTAVANSAGMAASMFGMDLTIVHPEGYALDSEYTAKMESFCKQNGSSFKIMHNQKEACKGADFVYAKSWGPLSKYGNFTQGMNDAYKHWIVDKEKMALTNNGYFSHCLPMRRNIKATDEVVDSPHSLIYDEAENRLHVQKAILTRLLGGN